MEGVVPDFVRGRLKQEGIREKESGSDDISKEYIKEKIVSIIKKCN